MSRPPIDINRLAARAQQAARALNPPERHAGDAIVRRASRGGPTLRVEATDGIVPTERVRLPGGLAGGTTGTTGTAPGGAAGGSVVTVSAAPPIASQTILIVVTLGPVKYRGATHSMTSREEAVSRVIVDQFTGVMDITTKGELRVLPRVVYRTELLDIDAWLDDPANYKDNGTARDDLEAVGDGHWIHSGIGDRLVTDQYGGDDYDGRVVLTGMSQIHSGALGLTHGSQGWTFISPDDGWYDDDRTNDRVTDILVHEYGHQYQGQALDLGQQIDIQDLAANYGYSQQPYRAWMDWYIHLADQVDWNAFRTRSRGAVKVWDPRTVAVPLPATPYNIDDMWGTRANRTRTPTYGGGLTSSGTTTAPTVGVQFGDRTSTDPNKVPRNSETQQRFDVNQGDTLVKNNPDHWKIGNGLVSEIDGGGVKLSLAPDSGERTVATHYRNVGLSIHDGFDVVRTQFNSLGGWATFDASGNQRSSIGPDGIYLLDAAGVLTTVIPTSGTPRFAQTPTVGPAGSSVPVALTNHVQTSATITDFVEAAQDAVAAMLASGTGVTLAYNDAANSLTITGTAGGGGTTDLEAVRDAIGVALVGASPISIVVNDAADTITISTTATQNSTDAALRDRGTHTGLQAIATVTGLQAALDNTYTEAEANTLLAAKLDIASARPVPYQAFYSAADWINTTMSLPTTLTARSAVTIPANTLIGVPVFLARSRTVDRLSALVNTAVTGNIRLGIARLSDDGFTATLLADAGATSTSTTGAKSPTVSVVATPGWYMPWAITDVAVSVGGLVNSAFLAGPWDALGTGGESVAVGSTPIRKLFYSAARAYGPLPATLTFNGSNLSNAAVPILSVRTS